MTNGDDETIDETPSRGVETPEEAEPPSGTTDAGDVSDEAEVWQSFEQSVEYMCNLSALYKDAFLKKRAVPSVAHVNAAKEHAREALELLASNLLNASTAVVAAMETQEEKLAAVDHKLERVKQKMHGDQEMLDQEVIRSFFERADREIPRQMSTREDQRSHQSEGPLKLTLAGATSSSTMQSPYLYLAH